MTIIGLCIPSMICFVTTINLHLGMYDALSTMFALEKKVELHLLKLQSRKTQLEILRDRDLRETMDYQIFYSVNSALNSILVVTQKLRSDRFDIIIDYPKIRAESAKAQGNNMDFCYSNAYQILYNRTMQTIESGMSMCLNKFRQVYLEEFKPIEELITKFQHVQDELGDLLFSCSYYGDLTKDTEDEAKTCIYVKESKIATVVKGLEEELKSVKMEEDSSYPAAFETFTECIRPHSRTLDEFAFLTQFRGVNCVMESSGA